MLVACTSRPGKSWRRPKCRLYARGVSVMRAAASCPTIARNISEDDEDDEDDVDRAPSRRFLSLSLRFRPYPLQPFSALFSLRSLGPLPACSFSRALPRPRPASLLPHHMKSSWRIYDVINYCLLGGKARGTPMRVWNKRKLDYARIIPRWHHGDLERLLRRF